MRCTERRSLQDNFHVDSQYSMRAQSTTQVSQQPSPAHDNGPPAEWLALVECALPRPSPDRFGSLFLADAFNWPGLLQRAEDHGLTLLLTERVKNLNQAFIPLEFRDQLRELQRSCRLSALQLTAELFRVLDCLAVSGIDVLLTKGPALSVRCYGEPDMRQYGDIDLIVRESDIGRVTQAMVELAYQPRVPLWAIEAKKSAGEHAFRKSGTDVLVEFHTERTFRYHPCSLRIEKVFERSAFVTIDGREVPVLSLEEELVLICVHGAKHFWERLMWIADVAALISRQPLDWDRTVAMADEVGAQRIVNLGLCLASDLLGAELPPQLGARIRLDRTVAKLAAQIERRLAHSQPREFGVLQRAAFRVQMREGLLPGLAYLLRLTLSPTEEDWTPGKEGDRPAFLHAIVRPFRLARKHSHRSSQ
jgi:Uncharacterised nucleotidyltransferase